MLPRRRILVAEYNLGIAELIGEILEAHGFDIAGVARTVPEAMELCERDVLDGAVLDLILGGSFCYELMDRLSRQQIPIIFFSRYRAEALPAELRSRRLLHKPEGILELADAAREIFAD